MHSSRLIFKSKCRRPRRKRISVSICSAVFLVVGQERLTDSTSEVRCADKTHTRGRACWFVTHGTLEVESMYHPYMFVLQFLATNLTLAMCDRNCCRHPPGLNSSVSHKPSQHQVCPNRVLEAPMLSSRGSFICCIV